MILRIVTSLFSLTLYTLYIYIYKASRCSYITQIIIYLLQSYYVSSVFLLHLMFAEPKVDGTYDSFPSNGKVDVAKNLKENTPKRYWNIEFEPAALLGFDVYSFFLRCINQKIRNLPQKKHLPKLCVINIGVNMCHHNSYQKIMVLGLSDPLVASPFRSTPEMPRTM